MSPLTGNFRPPPDPLLAEIADYVCAPPPFSGEAYETARYCLLDTLGCGILALGFPACAKLLGPVVPGTLVPNGARVPGTRHELDPVTAAFNIGCLIRWLDFNDTWLAAEWGHPSDNLGAILAVADFVSRAPPPNQPPLTMRAVLTAMIQAHEIQGVLALQNSFNRVGLDHVLLVRVASTAVAARLAGRHARTNHQRPLQCLGGWRGLARLPARAQHRLAQIVGGGRRHGPGRATRAHGPEKRNGLSLRSLRQNLGFLRRALRLQADSPGPPAGLLRHGERAL